MKLPWLVGAVVIMAAALATWFAFQSPQFVAGLAGLAAAAAWKAIAPAVLKRMDKDTEARWRACELHGGKWNNRTKKCE